MSNFVACEIGSWKGRSSRAIADNLPDGGVLYCVDTWGRGVGDAFASANDREGDGAYFQFCQNLFDHIQAGKVIALRMTSTNAAELLRAQGVTLKFCFIDGLHDEASIRADILNWQPLLAEGGLLCGHDYSSTFPDVCKVVDELLIARQPPNTGIWEALDKPNITDSVEGYGGFFCTEKQTNSLSA